MTSPFLGEFLGTMTLIILGDGVVAGALLKKSKGENAGWIAITAGWAFAAYAVCVFPANIKHAMDNVNVPPIPSSWWYHGPRLAFQPVFVWWALWVTGIIDWPFRRDPASSDPSSRP